MSSSSIAGWTWPGGERAPLEELAILIEARSRLAQEVLLGWRREEPLEAVEVADGRADPVAEDREEGGVLEDGVAPLHPAEGAHVLEEADLEAHRRDPRVHQAPVSLGQLPGDDQVPGHEGPHHEEQTSRRRGQAGG